MSNNVLFKDLTPGATIFALIKGDDLLYKECSIVNVGLPRMEMPQGQQAPMSLPTNVVDVTFTCDGKSVTEVIGVNDAIHPAKNMGATTLLATDKEAIVRELRATLKIDEDYLANVQAETKKKKKQAEQCKTLIGQLDTAFAEKQAFEQRIAKLEEGTAQTNNMLQQIWEKLKDK